MAFQVGELKQREMLPGTEKKKKLQIEEKMIRN